MIFLTLNLFRNENNKKQKEKKISSNQRIDFTRLVNYKLV